jgi:hypothetical protein
VENEKSNHTEHTIIYALPDQFIVQNIFRTYKSSPHRENGSKKEKPQPKFANLKITIPRSTCLLIIEVVHTDLYGSVLIVINVASKFMLPQNTRHLDFHAATKSVLP